MVNYTCNKCNKIFNHKWNYVRHINRKKPCVNNLQNGNCNQRSFTEIPRDQKNDLRDQKRDQKNDLRDHFFSEEITNKLSKKKKNLECEFCNKKFSYKTNYYRHMKHNCKKKKKDKHNEIKKELEIEKKKVVEMEKNELIKKLEEAEKKIDELKKSQVINNYNNNITVIAHNKQPDLSHLTDKDYLKIMNKGFKSVPKLIEAIHFNPDKPENQNVYIPNIKNNYVMAWDGKKWNLRPREDVLDDMYDDNSNILLDKLEQLEINDSKKNNVLKKFRRFIDQKEENEIKNKIKNDIKLLLYNKKTIIKN